MRKSALFLWNRSISLGEDLFFFSCIAANTGQSDLFLDTYENNKVYCQSRGGMRYGKNPKCISWTVGWADCCN